MTGRIGNIIKMNCYLRLNKQFYKDGTSFEGSSHYSAFVTEALSFVNYQ